MGSKPRLCTHWPSGACAGDRQVLHDGDVHVLLGVIYHTVDGIYVKASVLRTKEFGRILWRHKNQTLRVLAFVIWGFLFLLLLSSFFLLFVLMDLGLLLNFCKTAFQSFIRPNIFNPIKVEACRDQSVTGLVSSLSFKSILRGSSYFQYTHFWLSEECSSSQLVWCWCTYLFYMAVNFLRHHHIVYLSI